MSAVTTPAGIFEQPDLPIAAPESFQAVRTAIESAFSASRVADFLRSLKRKSLRVRQFEGVLGAGLLSEAARLEYAKLDNGDQGQIREFYLAMLERVPTELRNKYSKLYAYY